jgi:hypothetical protein
MHYLTEREEEFVEARSDMPVKLAYEPTLQGAPEPQRRIEILSARTSRFWWCMRTTSPHSRSPD